MQKSPFQTDPMHFANVFQAEEKFTPTHFYSVAQEVLDLLQRCA